MTAYDRLVTPKWIHFIPYWVIIGLIYFLITELAVRLVGETYLFVFRFLLAFGGITAAGIITNIIKKRFNSAMQEYSTVAEFPHKNSEGWIKEKSEELFSLNTWTSKVVWICVDIGVMATVVIVLGSPFHSIPPYIFGLIVMQPIILLMSQGAYFLIVLLMVLSQVVKYPVKVPFFMNKPPAIMKLFNFYSRTTFLILIAHIVIVLIIWQSPYGINGVTSLWLIVGFYPLLMLLWSMNQFHVLMKRIKQDNVEIINNNVQFALASVQLNPRKDNIAQLSDLIEIQNHLEKSPEWPIATEGLITIFATGTVPIVNIFLTIYNNK
jgi:hypothetical protein